MSRLAYWRLACRLWYGAFVERLCWSIAFAVPRRIALLVFVRVYASTLEAPGPEYERVYRTFEGGAGQ